LETVEAVCGENLPIEVFDGLASLVDKSLVQRRETSAGEARFVLLEMIHEYAREQLEANGELVNLRRQHAVYFADLAERAEPELRLAHQKYWFHLLETEIDNLRAALEWSLESGDVTIGIRIMSGTFLYWILYSRQDEGIYWTQPLLARIDEVAQEYQYVFSKRGTIHTGSRTGNRLPDDQPLRDWRQETARVVLGFEYDIGGCSEAEVLTQKPLHVTGSGDQPALACV
jgi:hypothetical protein